MLLICVQSILLLTFCSSQKTCKGIRMCSFFTEMLKTQEWFQGGVRHVAWIISPHTMSRGFPHLPASCAGRLGRWPVLANGLWVAVIYATSKPSNPEHCASPFLFLFAVTMELISWDGGTTGWKTLVPWSHQRELQRVAWHTVGTE